jgi:regulator of replication initiation timing
MKLMEMDMKAMVTRNEEMHKQLQALRGEYDEKQKAIDNFVQENERLLLTNKQLLEKQ